LAKALPPAKIIGEAEERHGQPLEPHGVGNFGLIDGEILHKHGHLPLILRGYFKKRRTGSGTKNIVRDGDDSLCRLWEARQIFPVTRIWRRVWSYYPLVLPTFYPGFPRSGEGHPQDDTMPFLVIRFRPVFDDKLRAILQQFGDIRAFQTIADDLVTLRIDRQGCQDTFVVQNPGQ
jgi:hypothetical protein